MNIEFYAIDKDGKVNETLIHGVSDDLFESLTRSEFSAIGVSRTTPVTFEEEVVDVKLVLLSPFVRSALVSYLKDFLMSILEEAIHKLGESPSTVEYQEYTQDLKVLLGLIRSMESERFTHFYRMG